MSTGFLMIWFWAAIGAGVVIAFVFLANRRMEPRGFPVEPTERKG